ncbi:MAG TPA: hypothetical protein VIM98_02540 [Dyella sp.]|uniref:hypothetical protein n=1 Tax=Dyella sp. TaxID=1869338 RepID=UPI002F959C04
MDELLQKATQGVDLDDPGAVWQIFANLMGLVPWISLFWWTVAFIAVGALLGWWRGRLWEGIWLSAVLGPIGWVVVLRPKKPRVEPPPLPR